MYFIEINFNFSKCYAYIAEKTCQYNTKVLVNKVNLFLMISDVTRAKNIYLESIGIPKDRVQEIYNIVLDNVRLYLPEESSQAFDKLLSVVMNYKYIFLPDI